MTVSNSTHRHSILVAVFALVLALLMTGTPPPVGADEHATDDEQPIEVRKERVYFHCADETLPYQNLAWRLGNTPTWDTTPPEGTTDEGAGCRYLEGNGYVREAQWEGTFKGNLRYMTIITHRIRSEWERQRMGDEAMGMWYDVTIDGRTCSFGATRLDQVHEDPVLDRFELTMVGFPYHMQSEPGEGETVRNIHVRVHTYADPTKTTGSEWVFDAEDMDSGIIFNTDDPDQQRGFPVWNTRCYD